MRAYSDKEDNRSSSSSNAQLQAIGLAARVEAVKTVRIRSDERTPNAPLAATSKPMRKLNYNEDGKIR